MSTDFETYLLSKDVSQIHVDTLQANGIDNKKILMFATINDFSSILQLPMFSAVCLFHMIRDPFQLPTTVQQVLSSAQVADRHLIFFRRLEIKSVNELKGVTAKHLRGMACPVFPAHLLEIKLQDYFNNKRKRSDSPMTSPKRQRSFSEEEGYGTEVQESDSEEEELSSELNTQNKLYQGKKVRAGFTSQEDAAILEGVKIFGEKHWSTILNHFDILKNAGRLPTSLANRYKNYLKESEEESDSDTLLTLLNEALGAINTFRADEGKTLEADLTEHIDEIENLLVEALKYENERTETVRTRILSNLEDAQQKDKIDMDRFEQEMIFYMEKYDISEEKVRLKAHCDYFKKTMKDEVGQGKKLGFISQEIGREINTLGSKSNHAQMQKLVVQMKDQLEKIKEQVLNVL